MTKRSAIDRSLRVSAGSVLGGFLCLLLAFLGSSDAQAQSAEDGSESEAVIQQVATTAPTSDAAKRTNVSEGQLLQSLFFGGGSEAGASSFTDPLFQNGQRSFVFQQGIGNDATIDQQGSSNFAGVVHFGNDNETLIQQRGTSNKAGIVLDGNRNEVELFQEGTDNEYFLGFRGDGLDLTRSQPGGKARVQIGTNNRLIELGQNSIPLNIQQRGNGMRMMIRHNTPQ